jgi:hypothetical protein
VIDPLAFLLTVGALGLAGVVVALGRRYRRALVLVGVLELGLLAQAGLDVAGLVAGHRPESLPTHVAYLVTSVVLLPAAVAWARGTGLVVAVGLVSVAVVVVRQITTWRS